MDSFQFHQSELSYHNKLGFELMLQRARSHKRRVISRHSEQGDLLPLQEEIDVKHHSVYSIGIS